MCVCFGRVSCTALIPAPQAPFMVQFPVVAWGLHLVGIIMVSCSAFLWRLHDVSSIYYVFVFTEKLWWTAQKLYFIQKSDPCTLSIST